MSLTHDELRKTFLNRTRLEPLDVPDFHPDAYVRHLMGGDVDTWRKYIYTDKGTHKKQSTYWMIAVLCNADGQPLFPVDFTKTPDEINTEIEDHSQFLLDNLDLSLFNVVGSRVYEANGMGIDAEKKEKND
eukprot:Platyproteum_vivax@DN2138_c0_g1_i1.p1